MAETAERTCYRHPDRTTGLSCSECGRPICTECMTPAPVGLRCPEHSGKPQGLAKVTHAAERAVTGNQAGTAGLVTRVLIGLNVAVYALELLAGGTINGTANWLFTRGALVANGVIFGDQLGSVPENAVVPSDVELVGVAQGEWWRLVTSAFLHYGPIHLALNMYLLYFAGPILEHVIGRWRFVLLYLASGIAGAAGALLWSPNAVTVGASGAIFGMMGALFVLERGGRISSGGQIGGLILINLIFTFVFASFISVGGHVGGLLGGLAAMAILSRFRRSTALSLASLVGVGVVGIAVAYFRVRGYA